MIKERSTKEINIESVGATIVMYDYITGRDRRNIESFYLDAAQITQKTDINKKTETEISGVTGKVNHLMLDATLKAVIKEVIDGEKIIKAPNEIVSFVLDLPEIDYKKVIASVNEVTDPVTDPKGSVATSQNTSAQAV